MIAHSMPIIDFDSLPVKFRVPICFADLCVPNKIVYDRAVFKMLISLFYERDSLRFESYVELDPTFVSE